MITLGDYNTLRITKRVDFGLYLSPIGEGPLYSGDTAAPYEKILLPSVTSPPTCASAMK